MPKLPDKETTTQIVTIGLFPVTILFFLSLPGLFLVFLLTGGGIEIILRTNNLSILQGLFFLYPLIFFIGGTYGLLSSWIILRKYKKCDLSEPLSNVWIIGNIVTLLTSIYWIAVFGLRLSPDGVIEAYPKSNPSFIVVGIFSMTASIFISWLIAEITNKSKLTKATIALSSIAILLVIIIYTIQLHEAHLVNKKSLQEDYSHIILPTADARFLNNNAVVSLSQKNIKIWSIHSKEESLILEEGICEKLPRKLSVDGRYFIVAQTEDTIAFCNLASGKKLVSLSGVCEHNKFGCFVDKGIINLDNSRIVTVKDKTIYLWNTETGKLIKQLEGHCIKQVICSIFSVDFNHDGTRIVTTSSDGTARVWNAQTGEQITLLQGHCKNYSYSCTVFSASFNADGSLIITASEDKTAKIWNAHTGEQLVDLIGHTNYVRTAFISPDGNRVLTSSWDNTAKIWDAHTGKQIVSIYGGKCTRPSACVIMSAYFNHNASQILTTSRHNPVQLWNAHDGALLGILGGHKQEVDYAAFSNDGNYVLSHSLDSLKIWNISTQRIPPHL